MNYMEVTGFLGDEQAGFRKGHSTLDHIFVLHTVIDLYLREKKRVFCAFIDYKKAFDLIDRQHLWSKLVAHDINGRVLQVIHAIYRNAKSRVVNNGVKSGMFDCNVGVRQGKNLSPICDLFKCLRSFHQSIL